MLHVALMSLAVLMASPTEVRGADYSGSSTLAAWGRTSVLRASCKAKRSKKRAPKVVGSPAPASEIRQTPLEKPSGNIHVYSVNYQIEAKVNIFNEDGSYNLRAISEVEHIFRCRRSGREHTIDSRLLNILSHVYDKFGKRVELLSGYRFQRRTTSHHFDGTASDIRIPGVDAKRLRNFIHTLDTGGMGVGYYPRVGFVHVDIRQPPSYRWIDYSRTNPDAYDKQPPSRPKKRPTPQS